MTLSLVGVPLDVDRGDPRALGQWYTPDRLARRVAEWAGVRGLRVLEPSAGTGRLAVACRDAGAFVDCVEVTADNCGVLEALGFAVERGDFCSLAPRDEYDLAVGNPPFENGGEGRHIEHALRWAPSVVAVLRMQSLAGIDRHSRVWGRAWLARLAICVGRPAFAESGGTFEVIVADVRREGSGPTAIEWWEGAWK